jgi:hypothetical protein
MPLEVYAVVPRLKPRVVERVTIGRFRSGFHYFEKIRIFPNN